MGTPDFAAASLRALCDSGYDVVGVFCQPDRPKGRGNRLTPCPVKEEALRRGIAVFQPERIKRPEGVEALRSLSPDLCVTAAFGQLLSQEILDIPPMGTVNVHSSLLPRHRGSAPVNWAVIQGDAQTGVTTMLTDAGMDTGDMLLCERTDIGAEETAGELTDRLAEMGAALLIRTLRGMEAGTIRPAAQNPQEATYEPKLTKETGRIDFARTAREIDCLVRGTSPWPGAFTTLPDGQVMKVMQVRRVANAPTLEPGRIVSADGRGGLIISCGDGDVELVQIQMPGAKRMNARDYLRGHSMEAGTVLGRV